MYNVLHADGADRIMHVTSPLPRRARLLRLTRRVLIAVCLVVFVECAWFNLPYVLSIGASGDSVSAHNELGPGLQRTAEGMLKVTDPTTAWLRTQSDGSSEYWRVDPTPMRGIDAALAGPWSDDVVTTVHMRLEAHGVSGAAQSVSPYAPRSLYIRDNATGTTTIWVEETRGALVPIENVRANVRVPFEFDWARVGTMVAVALVVIAFLPGSWLWRTRLDTASKRQRWLFALALAPLAFYTVWHVVWGIRFAAPLRFHTDGGYTYDFDQYGHVADALLHGRLWLDLPVPQELAQAANPYDVAQRDRLFDKGVSPVYWDYAFRDGHWYSYFGVLPSLLLFAPFRVVSSWFTPGGMMLPARCAELLLMFGMAVCSCLLVIRVLKRIVGAVPLATVVLACVAYLIGATAPYLWFRTNFYSIPFAASLLLVAWGLWLWLGAERGDGTLSWPHVAAGAACIAATLGCRPTFALTAVLALPLFWHHLYVWFRARDWRGLVAWCTWMLVPAAVVVAPVLAYNQLRFGSLFDFGNAYQITVADMTSFSTPWRNVPGTILYYLFLPLRPTGTFPFLEISSTPLPAWSFTEPSIGGLCVLMPLAALAFAVPFLRRRLGALWPTLVTMLALAVVLLVFDSIVGGFGWRYMADFGWLFMLCALPVAAQAMQGRRWVRAIVALVMAYAVVVWALSCFVVGRDDMLVVNEPGLYHAVRSWFTLLP